MTKDEVRHTARQLGIDLVGFTTVERVDQRLPQGLQFSNVSRDLPVFLALAKQIPVGIMGARDGNPKPMACSLVHRVLEEAAAELAYHLESHDCMAVCLPSLSMDFKHKTELSNTPAGQGSFDLRVAAVEAGLGTLGLNNMLLTPRFGPRIYLCGMLTNLEAEPDSPLQRQLCLGLEECGRCAAVCPGDAIPRHAPRGAALDSVRRLDEAACAQHSQPYGPQAFADAIQRLASLQDAQAVSSQIQGSATSQLWHHMTILRQGAFTGCSRCLQVCPVGEDWEKLQESPHRRQDLPASAKPYFERGLVRIENFSGDRGAA